MDGECHVCTNIICKQVENAGMCDFLMLETSTEE